MIDPIQLPILMKAIDFVFEEGRKILQERRERRQAQENAAKAEAETQPPLHTTSQETTEVVVQTQDQVKQDLLASKIDEILWQNHEAEVQHLVRLLDTYCRNYQIAREQYAKWGSALVPPIIVHNLNEAEDASLQTIEKLKAVLAKVYEKEIPAAE
jgi:hypothetical protein